MLMSAAVMMLASCSQNEDLLQTDLSSDEVQVTFNVRTPGMQTRAVDAESDETEVTRYVCQIWEGNGVTVGQEPERTIEQTGTNFTMLLKKNTRYTLLLWADRGNVKEAGQTDATAGNYYDVSNLTQVKVVPETTAGGSAELAFYACQPVNVTSTADITEPVDLKHAVAKVCLYETNVIAKGSSLSVEYTPARTFNAAEGMISDNTEKKTLTFQLDANGVDATATTGGKQIARFYVLAPEKEKSEGLSTLTFTLSEPQDNTANLRDEMETVKSVSNVPLQANYVTNIRGEFSDYTNKNFNVTLDGNWSDPQFEVPLMLTADDLATADALKATIDANGNTGTLKLTGDVSQANIDVVKEVFQSAGYSYVLDMTDANLTDEVPLGEFSFKGTAGLKGIICPKNLTELGVLKVFAECQAEFITLPAGMTYVGPSQTFRDSPNLKYVNLEDTQVEELSNNMFTNCTALEKIAFPSKINLIETDAFAGCTSLTEMDFSRCTAVPRNSEFDNLEIDKITVYVSADMLQSFTDAWGSRGFKSIEIKK